MCLLLFYFGYCLVSLPSSGYEHSGGKKSLIRSSWLGNTQVSSCAFLLGGDGNILITVSLGLSWDLELTHQAG